MTNELTKQQRIELEALAAMPDSEIDFSDIPEITDEQWSRFRPARDFEEVRRWEDQHHSPEQIAASEEFRKRWHAKHDPKS